MSNYGIRYVVIGLGSPEEPCEQEDIQGAWTTISKNIPFKAVVLNDRVSDKLTVALLQEARTL